LSLLAGVACVAAWVAAGWWPMRAWAAPLAGASWYGRVALACALGAAVTGLAQVLLSACGVASGAAVPAALALASLAATWRRAAARAEGATTTAAYADGAGHVIGAARADVAASSDAGAPACRGSRGNGAPRAALPAWLAALLLAVTATSLLAAAGTPFRSDGSKFWAPRARELSRIGASEAPSLHDQARLGVHRDYPLLVPALLAPVFALAPAEATAGPKLALGALCLAVLGTLAALLPRFGTRGVVLLAAFAALPLLTSLDVRESAVAAGFVDGVAALFLLLLVVAVERMREAVPDRSVGARGIPGNLAAAGGIGCAALAGAALASTKLEGSVAAALVFGAASIAGPRRGALLAAAASALLLALPTFVIAAGVAPDEQGFSLARLVDAATWAARLPPVLAGLGGLLLDASCFGLLPLLLVVMACGRAPVPAHPADAAQRDTARRRRVFAVWVGAGATALLLASYLSTNMHAGRHMDTSAHRLLWQWLPAATWLVARRGSGPRVGTPAEEPRA
jgi:hypothetical protein